MDPYYNLPGEQRLLQRLVDQFNSDEELWKKLKPRRRFRRKLPRRVLSEGQIKRLDLLEFARERPPEDCIPQTLNP